MEKIQDQQTTIDNGAQPGKRLRLPDLPDYKLGAEGELEPFHATDAEFLQFAAALVPITGDGDLNKWTWEDRRDFLNWCLDENVLTIKDGRLLAVEETIPTAVLESGECLE